MAAVDECRNRLRQFQEIFGAISDALTAVDAIADVANTTAQINAKLSFDEGGIGADDLDDALEAGANLTQAIGEIGGDLATQTGNSDLANQFGKFKAGSDLLLMLRPSSIFGFADEMKEQLTDLIEQALEALENVQDAGAKLDTALEEWINDDGPEDLENRNQALFNQTKTDVERLLSDVEELLAQEGSLATRRVSADSICDGLKTIRSALLAPDRKASEIARLVQLFIGELRALSSLSEDIIDLFDAFLNQKSNFEQVSGRGFVAIRRQVLRLIRTKLLEFRDILNANIGNDNFDILTAAREFYFEVNFLLTIFCRDQGAIQEDIDTDPNAAVFADLISQLTGVSLDPVTDMLDQVNEAIRVARNVVHTGDKVLFDQVMTPFLNLITGVGAAYDTINTILSTGSFVSDPLGSAQSILDTANSGSFNRVTQLLTNGSFDGYFDSFVESANSAAALAECLSDAAQQAQDVFAREQLTLAANDCQALANAQAAQSRAVRGRGSEAFASKNTQQRTVDRIERVTDRFVLNEGA